MATVTKCPAGVWTTVALTAGADNSVEARGSIYYTTDGSEPADPSVAMSMVAMETRVINGDLTLKVQPSNIKYSRVVVDLI